MTSRPKVFILAESACEQEVAGGDGVPVVSGIPTESATQLDSPIVAGVATRASTRDATRVTRSLATRVYIGVESGEATEEAIGATTEPWIVNNKRAANGDFLSDTNTQLNIIAEVLMPDRSNRFSFLSANVWAKKMVDALSFVAL